MYYIFIYFIFMKIVDMNKVDMNLVVVLQSCFPEIVNCEYQNCEDNIHPSISTVHEVLCLVLCRSWKQIILIPGYASARVEAPALILWSWNFGHLARDSKVKDYQQLLINWGGDQPQSSAVHRAASPQSGNQNLESRRGQSFGSTQTKCWILDKILDTSPTHIYWA